MSFLSLVFLAEIKDVLKDVLALDLMAIIRPWGDK